MLRLFYTHQHSPEQYSTAASTSETFAECLFSSPHCWPSFLLFYSFSFIFQSNRNYYLTDIQFNRITSNNERVVPTAKFVSNGINMKYDDAGEVMEARKAKAQVSISIKRIFMTTIFTVLRINSGDKPDKLKALTGVGLGELVLLKLIGIDHFVFIASATANTIAEKAAKFCFRTFHGPAIPPRSHTKTVVCNEKHSNWHDQLNKWCFQWNQLKAIYFLCETEWNYK